MHEHNVFITLTYDDQHLKSDKLIYSDFQNFMKRLRKQNPHLEIGCFVTGEYGEIRKRPHWHAILFGWSPADKTYKYTTDRGDQVYRSAELERLWPYGISELGSVTFESAGYCARYAAKKLTHGKDQEHDYQPISKKSSKYAIGKRFIEKYFQSVFAVAKIILPEGQSCAIPRYYEKWLQKHEPQLWKSYRLGQKAELLKKLSLQSEQKQKEYIYDSLIAGVPQITENESRKIILEQKFNQLQERLKL